MKRWQSWVRGMREHFDRRDLLCLAGIASLGYGGEVLLPGAGFAAMGAVLIGIATLVR